MEGSKNWLINYLQGSVSEIKKVTWPTRETTIRNSIIVIALTVGVAVLFGVSDAIFRRGLAALISIF